jgi:hypothetical protein
VIELVPITLSDAFVWVREHHRHHDAPQGGLFAIAAANGGKIVGVSIIGRPVARNANDGWTAEVTRVCTDGTRNACSLLYGASWRAARAMGYRRLITYTLISEPGTSLRAAGFVVVGETQGGSWSRTTRPRVDRHPLQAKFRWEKRALASTVAPS